MFEDGEIIKERLKVSTQMNRVPHCAECEFMKKFNYGKKIYYCDHSDRIDDMGKLSVNELPKKSPEWCPLRK